jgi:hypothetical protein
MSLYFLLNSESGLATIAAKYGKDRKGNEEDIPLLKKARSHVSSEKFKKKEEILKDLRLPRWRPCGCRILGVFRVLGAFGAFGAFGAIGGLNFF